MAFKMKYNGFPKETKYLDDKENPKAKPPGYEPPVKRSDLDAAGKALWDANQGYTPRYTHRVPKAHGNK